MSAARMRACQYAGCGRSNHVTAAFCGRCGRGLGGSVAKQRTSRRAVIATGAVLALFAIPIGAIALRIVRPFDVRMLEITRIPPVEDPNSSAPGDPFDEFEREMRVRHAPLGAVEREQMVSARKQIVSMYDGQRPHVVHFDTDDIRQRARVRSQQWQQVARRMLDAPQELPVMVEQLTDPSAEVLDLRLIRDGRYGTGPDDRGHLCGAASSKIGNGQPPSAQPTNRHAPRSGS